MSARSRLNTSVNVFVLEAGRSISSTDFTDLLSQSVQRQAHRVFDSLTFLVDFLAEFWETAHVILYALREVPLWILSVRIDPERRAARVPPTPRP